MNRIMAMHSKKTAQSTKIGNDEQLPQSAMTKNAKKPQDPSSNSAANDPKDKKSRLLIT